MQENSDFTRNVAKRFCLWRGTPIAYSGFEQPRKFCSDRCRWSYDKYRQNHKEMVDVDKAREKALNVALNKITGAWDEQMLAVLLKDIEASGIDAMVTGFEPPEMEQLFNKVATKEVAEDDFDVEAELKKPTFSKAGDIWHLGRHIVICGDSTLTETYKHLMDGVKANLVLTDLPYNVNVEETAGKIQNDNMTDEDFYKFLLAAFGCMNENLADDGSIYVFHADTQGLNFRRAFQNAGFYLSGCCIWKKNALVLGRSPYQWQHEPCLFGWKQKGRHEWYSDRKQTTIWDHPVAGNLCRRQRRVRRCICAGRHSGLSRACLRRNRSVDRAGTGFLHCTGVSHQRTGDRHPASDGGA